MASPPPTPRIPSTANTGTFTASPQLKNQYVHDESLRRVVDFFIPSPIKAATSDDFTRFGDAVLSKQVLDWVSDAERNVPYLRGSGRDAFGRRTDELVTSEGWKELQNMGFREGIVAVGYENTYAEYSRLVQFVKYHLWSASNANVTCPSAMQDGAAALLKRHLTTSTNNLSPTTRQVFQSAFIRLTCRSPSTAWTSGQWMTERVGGSDVSGTETLAEYSPSTTTSTSIDGQPLGPWSISGFKWFSSATDAQMTVLLAQTPKRLSAFFAPLHLSPTTNHNPNKTTVLNGITISRLKSKLGTRPLPTAELELKNMRAHLIGAEGEGIKEISAVLNITRVHNAVTAVGLLGRGLAIAKAWAEVRVLPRQGKSGGLSLKDVPLHTRTLAKITLEYRANMLFTFFVVYLLGLSEHGGTQQQQHETSSSSTAAAGAARLRPQDAASVTSLLRILTPVLKALTARTCVANLQECIESLGGLGYLENEESQHINLARLYRDANVLCIWEGTTNVLGTDFVKILKGRKGKGTVEELEGWLREALEGGEKGDEGARSRRVVFGEWEGFKKDLNRGDVEEGLLMARELMERLYAVVAAVLLIVDAERDGDRVAGMLVERFLRGRGGEGGADMSGWREEVEWDRRIVFGGWEGVSKARL